MYKLNDRERGYSTRWGQAGKATSARSAISGRRWAMNAPVGNSPLLCGDMRSRLLMPTNRQHTHTRAKKKKRCGTVIYNE